MELTRDTRMNKLATSTSAVQHLYTNEEAGAKYREVFNASGLPEEQYGNYVLTIGDVVLGFYPISELATLLQSKAQIDEQTTKKITADLVDFLSPLMSEEDAPQEVKVQDTVAETPLTPTPMQPTNEPVPEVEEIIVQPLRTMEHDMDKIHGYGAYRKMYPDPEVESAIPEPTESQTTSTASPVSASSDEPVIQATSQDETLEGNPTLTDTPTYTEEDSKLPK